MITKLAKRRLNDFLDNLQELCSIDCGTANKAGVDHVGRWIQWRAARNGWTVQAHKQREVGDVVRLSIDGGGQSQVLLLAHMDTVYADGTCAARPVRVDSGRIYGPGVNDDKAGLLVAIYALEILQELKLPFGKVEFLCTSDEEVGSVVARDLIKQLARQSAVAICMEAARETGEIVSARPGLLNYRAEFAGVAAHSGIEPERGAHALLACARAVEALQALSDPARGITCNVGIMAGGRALNEVPDAAFLEGEARAYNPEDLAWLQNKITSILQTQFVPGTSSVLSTMELIRESMPHTEAVDQLVRLIQKLAADLGFSVNVVRTGGATDGNIAAGEGTPTIDGMGPIGGGDHSPNEHVSIDSIVPRMALLANLLVQLSASKYTKTTPTC